MSGTFTRRATLSAGMHRGSNAAPLSPRAARPCGCCSAALGAPPAPHAGRGARSEPHQAALFRHRATPSLLLLDLHLDLASRAFAQDAERHHLADRQLGECPLELARRLDRLAVD